MCNHVINIKAQLTEEEKKLSLFLHRLGLQDLGPPQIDQVDIRQATGETRLLLSPSEGASYDQTRQQKQ